MMKKILRTILRAIPVVLVLVFCLSVTAMAYSGSESVTLKTTQNEATSGSLSCHHAKVSATNSASSQHNVSAALQLSSGSGWSNYGIIINFLYFMIMLLKNVTIGCIPVVAYLLLCFYISGSADFASFSIIAPNLPAEFSNWNTLLVVFSSSLLGLLLGYLLDRFWYKYL